MSSTPRPGHAETKGDGASAAACMPIADSLLNRSERNERTGGCTRAGTADATRSCEAHAQARTVSSSRGWCPTLLTLTGFCSSENRRSAGAYGHVLSERESAIPASARSTERARRSRSATWLVAVRFGGCTRDVLAYLRRIYPREAAHGILTDVPSQRPGCILKQGWDSGTQMRGAAGTSLPGSSGGSQYVIRPS
ncbi:hypothetical protein GY45DRAFT_691824 [Cubamyces sp. BRFM 1775]|nr:hypothetical protein GY45DRAFT_691824 [Cubamyces sp. BRFM 1775]